MEHLFYLMVILCFLFELSKIANATDIYKFITMNNEYKENTGKTLEYSSWTQREKNYYSTSCIYLSVCILGLFSSQWIVFLAIFLQTIIMVIISYRHPILIKVDSAISALLLLFICLNKYHIHLDLFNLIFN